MKTKFFNYLKGRIQVRYNKCQPCNEAMKEIISAMNRGQIFDVRFRPMVNCSGIIESYHITKINNIVELEGKELIISEEKISL